MDRVSADYNRRTGYGHEFPSTPGRLEKEQPLRIRNAAPRLQRYDSALLAGASPLAEKRAINACFFRYPARRLPLPAGRRQHARRFLKYNPRLPSPPWQNFCSIGISASNVPKLHPNENFDFPNYLGVMLQQKPES